jgi:ribosomal protein S16
MTIVHRLTEEISDDESAFCHELFMRFYKEEYSNKDPNCFEFKMEDIDSWLQSQFTDKVGDEWLISSKGFLSYEAPEDEDYVNIFQMVIDADQANKLKGSLKFLKELGKLYPKRNFRSAIRKVNKEQAMMYLSMGCKVSEQVALPGFSSEYYLGVEMPSSLIKSLSLLFG